MSRRLAHAVLYVGAWVRVAVTQQMEEYLACIYRIAAETQAERVSTSQVARALSVSAASATYMFKRLAFEGLVHYEGYAGAALTTLGRALALRLIRTSRLTERILTHLFHFGWEEVGHLAQAMEGALPDAVIERAAELLQDPLTCPHGHPIPRRDGTIIEIPAERLTDVPIGEKREITRIDDTEAVLLQTLGRMGLVPGCTVRVIDFRPEEQTMVVEAEGTELLLGERLYQSIAVRIPGADMIVRPLSGDSC